MLIFLTKAALELTLHMTQYYSINAAALHIDVYRYELLLQISTL